MKAFVVILLISASTVSLAQSNQVPDNIEFQALKDLWDNTAGSGWTTKTNWPTAGNWPSSATAAQMGTWYGITVTNGDITSISFYNNNLVGNLPSSIGQLTKLNNLSVQSNKLSGSIPPEIGNLVNLAWLHLDSNQFSGTVPASIGNLTNLAYLYLNNNQLSGALPDVFGNLHSLYYFIVSYNQFSGGLPPSLGSCTYLNNYSATSNKFSGTIPSTYANLTHMQWFYVDLNGLSGDLPSVIGSWTALVGLELKANKFTGIVPSSLGNLMNLSLVDLQNNRFTGAFPSLSSPALTQIICSNNFFTSIPSTILTRPSLTALYLDNNELTSLPDFTTYSNKANLSLRVQNNHLDFSQLEPLTTGGLKAGGIFVPQKNISDIATQPMTIGSPLVITARPAGANTTFTWEKLSSAGAWGTVTNDDDAVARTYTRNTAADADAGVYRWKSTSTSFAGTTIMSDPIAVKTAIGFKMDNWCFLYQYDGRKRMIQKKVPGADWVYMVYDERDRLVMTQDGNQRLTNQWTFTRYDTLNRPIMTGLYTHPSLLDQAGMSALISKVTFCESFNGTNANYGYTNNVMPASRFTGTFEPLTITYYDNYAFLNNDPYFAYQWTTLTGQYEFTAGAHNAYPNVTGEVTGTWTKVLAKDRQWLRRVNYYDDKRQVVQTISDTHKRGQDIVTKVYDFTGKVLASRTETVDHHVTWGNADPNLAKSEDRLKNMYTANIPWAFATQQVAAGADAWVEYTVSPITSLGTTRTFGFSTSPSATNVSYGARVDIGNNTAFTLVMENGLSKGSAVTVQPGDVMRVERRGLSMRYSRNGVVFYTTTLTSSPVLYPHALLNQPGAELFNPMISVPGPKHSAERHFEYDHLARLLKTWHSTDDGTPLLLAKDEYNELGQLIDKKLHSTDNATFKQSLDYRYNIRGWLTSINGAQLTSDDDKNPDTGEKKDLFGMDLLYDQVDTGLGNTSIFNGNISAMSWSNNLGLGTIKERAYNFGYDPMNRLITATQKAFNVAWAPSNAYQETGLAYDLNGNIKSLLRTDAAGVQMDVLDYNYGTGDMTSNMLRKVTDTGTDQGFTDVPGVVDDYAYDNNGNLTIDKNKSLTAITYNHLNLPTKVTKSTGDYLTYLYDATGVKLEQDVYNPQGVLKKRSDYRGEWFYENDTLRFLNHEEGRVTMTTPPDQCVLCGDLAAKVNDYVTQYGLQSLSNGSQLTSYLNTALGMTSTSADYQASFQRCHVMDVAMNFAGSTKGYVSFGQPAQYNMGTGDFTIEAWIKLPVGLGSGLYPIVANQNYAGGAYSGINLTVNQQKIWLVLADGTAGGVYAGIYANVAISSATWHHIVAQRIGNTASNFKIYVDGVEAPKIVAGTSFTTGNLENTAIRDLKIGSRNGSFDNLAFQGSIKQVRIYKRILPASEVVSNFNNGYFQGPTDVTQMVLWAPLNEGQGTQVKDYSTYNQAGNIVGPEVTWTNNALPSLRAICPPNTEYQYHLKDHLGNVRLTFTTKDEVKSDTATLENDHITADRSNFLNYDDARMVLSKLFDHTNGEAPGYSQRLSGSPNEKIGLKKTLSVMPGDVVNAEVYAKYFDPNAPNLDAALQTLVSYLANPAGSGGAVVDGTAYTTANTLTLPWGASEGTQPDQDVPKAFLNYIFINRDYDMASMRFIAVPISAAALEDGTDRPHELLSISDNVVEPGYVCIYLTNDGEEVREVYFDDFTVEHVKGPVVQSQDYYPFGLKYNSYARENSLLNTNKLFQGQEHIDDLGLDWDSFKWRNHQPEIGRFFNVDPLSEKFYYNSPYAFSENKLTGHIELEGLEAAPADLVYALDPGKRVQAEYKKLDDEIIISPVQDPVINSEFGPREKPVAGASDPHPAVDIVRTDPAQTLGTPVVAPLNGKITAINPRTDGNGAGNRIHMTANRDGKRHSFFHMQDGFGANLTVGQEVKRGTVLGTVGSTGNVSGPHLHYEIRQNGVALNPRLENSALTNAPTDIQARSQQDASTDTVIGGTPNTGGPPSYVPSVYNQILQ